MAKEPLALRSVRLHENTYKKLRHIAYLEDDYYVNILDSAVREYYERHYESKEDDK